MDSFDYTNRFGELACLKALTQEHQKHAVIHPADNSRKIRLIHLQVAKVTKQIQEPIEDHFEFLCSQDHLKFFRKRK